VDLCSAFIVVGAQVRITQFYLQISPYLPLSRISVHQMRWRTSNCSLLLTYLPRKDKRLSRPGRLTYTADGLPTLSGHPSVVCRAQDRESSPVKDRRSTTVPRNQPDITPIPLEKIPQPEVTPAARSNILKPKIEN